MNKKTIDQLNQLNNKFYDLVADDFNDSRNYFWQGWYKALESIKDNFKDKKISVLDIGCGNGRFAKFLEEEKVDFKYYGLDSSTKLLNLASKQVSPKVERQFLQFDIINQLEEDSFGLFLKKNTLRGTSNINYSLDLIVSFGVLHHIPSFELRKHFFNSLSKQLSEDGLIIITAWQFLDNPKLKERLIDFEKIGIDRKEVEENDYLLDWRRGEEAIRYCHLTTESEMGELIEGTSLKIVETYKADSKTNNLNQYYLLKKEKESRL